MVSLFKQIAFFLLASPCVAVNAPTRSQTYTTRTAYSSKTGQAPRFLKTAALATTLIPFAGAEPQTNVQSMAEADPHTAKFMNNQNEMAALLADPSAMRTRFTNFIVDKYEDKSSVSSNPWSAAAKAILDKDQDGEVDDLKVLEEQEPKYANFKKNVALAYQRNKAGDGSVIHGITGLMDLSKDEFKQLLGYKPPADHMKGKKPEDVLDSLTDSPNGGSRDWRDEGAITPVKDQGQCGSCWAFSTVESVESAALAQGLASKDSPFIGAPQELVSCDKGSDQGCNGGLPSNAFKYLSHVPLEPEADYPYKSGSTQHDGRCKLDKSEGKYKVVSQKQVSIWGIGEKSDMTDYILGKGPMSVAVHANDAWQTYKGGVMGYDQCDDLQGPNHAVQAVALKRSTDSNGKHHYWVIRNSWNSNWGEDGFIRLAYGKNVCNVAYMGVGVKVEKAEEDVEKPHGFMAKYEDPEWKGPIIEEIV